MITQDNSIFPLGNPGQAEWFTGEVHVQSLVSPEKVENLYNVGQVTFSPGARTHWHTHPIGQVLLVLEGTGWYQQKGQPAQIIHKGSTVAIPKDVEHWHGASEGEKLVHIAISNIQNGNSVTWLSPVTNTQYAQVHQK
jgi:4-carboxymuconolactone decarboxylase